MKKISVFCSVFLVSMSAAAQSGEWISQKRTQKKYLLEQIAALKVYSGYISKGYSIAHGGLNTIQNIKKGDLRQHTSYFLSLSVVNPKIRRYVKVADIIAIQLMISKQIVTATGHLRGSNQFKDEELSYIKQVFDKLLDGCIKNLDELYMLITDGEIQMKDDERIKAIDRIYDDIRDKKIFAQSFSNNASILGVHRLKEARDIKVSRKLNEIP